MPPKGLTKAERQRRAAQSARDRARSRAVIPRAPMNKSYRFVSRSAPVAQGFSVQNTTPRFSSIPGGIRVTHSQRVAAVQGIPTGQPFAYPMTVAAAGWLSEISNHFQHYSIQSMNYRYISRVPTSTVGTVVMAPYYEAELPKNMNVNDVNGLFDFLRDLPGVKEFATWTCDQVGVITRNFTRKIFKVLGVLEATPVVWTGINAQVFGEAGNPGWILGICQDENAGSGRDSGELWQDYVVDLLAPRSGIANWVSMYSPSTDKAHLGLNSSCTLLGNPLVAYPNGDNAIKFGFSGVFTVIVQRLGTTPTEAVSSISIRDASGIDVTSSRTVGTFTGDSFGSTSTPASQGLYAATSAQSLTVFFVRVYIGDYFILPTVSGTSLTDTRIHVLRGGVSSLLLSD